MTDFRLILLDHITYVSTHLHVIVEFCKVSLAVCQFGELYTADNFPLK